MYMYCILFVYLEYLTVIIYSLHLEYSELLFNVINILFIEKYRFCIYLIAQFVIFICYV